MPRGNRPRGAAIDAHMDIFAVPHRGAGVERGLEDGCDRPIQPAEVWTRDVFLARALVDHHGRMERDMPGTGLDNAWIPVTHVDAALRVQPLGCPVDCFLRNLTLSSSPRVRVVRG